MMYVSRYICRIIPESPVCLLFKIFNLKTMEQKRNGLTFGKAILILVGVGIIGYFNHSSRKNNKSDEQIRTETQTEIDQRDFEIRMNRPTCSECGHQYNESEQQVFTTNDGQTLRICGKSECYGNLMARQVNSRY